MALFNFFGKKEIETPSVPQAVEPEKKAMKITKKSPASNPLLSDASLSVVDRSIVLREQEDTLIKQKIQVDNREIALNKREKEVEALLEELKRKIAGRVSDVESEQFSDGQATGEGIDLEDATNQLLLWEERLIEKEKELGEFHEYLQQKEAEIQKGVAIVAKVDAESNPLQSNQGSVVEPEIAIDVEDATSQLMLWEERLLEKEKELGDFHAYLEEKQLQLEEFEARLQNVPIEAAPTAEQPISHHENQEEGLDVEDATSQLLLWEEKLIAKEEELLELENTLAVQLGQVSATDQLKAEVPDNAIMDESAHQNVEAVIDSSTGFSAAVAQETSLVELTQQFQGEITALQVVLAEKDQQILEAHGAIDEYLVQLQTQSDSLQQTQAKLDEMQRLTEGNLDVVAAEVQQIQDRVQSLTEELHSTQKLSAEQQTKLIEMEQQLEEKRNKVAALEAIKLAVETKFQDALGAEKTIGIELTQKIGELEETIFAVRNELQETVSLKISAEEEFAKQLSAQQAIGKKTEDLLEVERSIFVQEQQLQELKNTLESKEKDIALQVAALDEKVQSFEQLQENIGLEQRQKFTQIAESEQQLAVLEKELKEKEDWILQQQTIAAESMLNSKDMEQLWAEKEAMIAKKEQAIVEYKTQISQLKASVKEQQKDAERQSKDFAKSAQQTAKLESELSAQKEVLSQQVVDIAALQARESALLLEIDSLKADLATKQQLASDAFEQKETDLANKAAELAALEQQLLDSRSALETELSKIAQKEESIRQEHERIVQAQAELQRQQSAIEIDAQALMAGKEEIEQKLQTQAALEQAGSEQALALEAAKVKLEADQASFTQKMLDFENSNAEIIERQGLVAEQMAAIAQDTEAAEALKAILVAERATLELAKVEGEKHLAEQRALLLGEQESARQQQLELETIRKVYDEKDATYQTLLTALTAKEAQLVALMEAFEAEKVTFAEKNSDIVSNQAKFDELEQQLNDKSNQISLVEQLLQDRDAQLNQREKELQQITKEINQQSDQLQQREQELNQWQKRLESQQKPVLEEVVEKPARSKQPERPVEVVPEIVNLEPFNVNINLEDGEALEAELEGSFTGNDIIETLIDNELIAGNTSYAIYWEEGRKWIDLTEKIGSIGLSENSSIKIERR